VYKVYQRLKESSNKIVAFHSSPYNIEDFNNFDIQTKSLSSTRIQGLFFSLEPQYSWGEYLYKVEILYKSKLTWDQRESKYDTLGIQEMFDALLRGGTYYICEDALNQSVYQHMSFEELEEYFYDYSENVELFEIKNTSYAKHSNEIIIPDLTYYGRSNSVSINILNFYRLNN
jgi:uncharacterized protein (DUF2249 family)